MRWVFRIIGAFGAALLLAVGLVLALPGDKIARIAADQVKAHTGRDLTLQGDVTVRFWPVLGVETGPVTLANADWAGPDPMLQAQSLSIGVAAGDLMRGTVRVTQIIANSPDLRLQTNKEGRGNWQFGTSAPSGTAPGNDATNGTPITLERLSLSDARLTYLADGAAPVTLSGVDLALDWPKVTGPADLVARLRPAGEPIEIVAQVTRFAQFLEGAVSPVKAHITAPDGDAKFEGHASIVGDAKGQITVQSKNTARTLAAMGLDGIELPQDLGQEIAIAGEATYTTDGRLSLRDMSLDMDGNALSGAADIVLGDVPEVTARLNAGVLDFSHVTQFRGEGGGDTTEPVDTGWSVTPIDADALGRVNVSIKVSAQSVRTSAAQFGLTLLAVRLDQSRAVIEIGQLGAFGGSVSGQVVVNNRQGLSLSGNLRASDISVQQALQDLVGIERLSGTAAGHIEFLGVGESVDGIMKSLQGRGAASVQQGAIAGLDLGHLMRDGVARDGTTAFENLSATFTLNDGDLVNKDLLLALGKFNVEGAGRVGLGTRDIDYVLTRVGLRDTSGLELVLPVRIHGPWADPAIRPDLSAALKSGVDVNLDTLEQDARDVLQHKVMKELDVSVGEGQDVEELLKDKLEDKAKTGLLKLLGKE